jgi:hypothetical protein
MKPFQPGDEYPIELLAAYADGELDEAVCAQVEAWLADHPEAQTDLFEQRELSPANVEFWNEVEPPMPSAEQWDRVYDRVANRLVRPAMPVRSRRRMAWYLVPAFSMAGLAAALLFVVTLNNGATKGLRSLASHSSVAAFDEEDESIYRIATADDVEIFQLPEEASSLIVVGRHPMSDTPLVLAATTDLEIFSLGPDDQGRMPNVELTAGANAPMLVAQTPRQ